LLWQLTKVRHARCYEEEKTSSRAGELMVKAYQIWGCCLACFFSCLAANKEKINYIKSKYEHTLFGKQHLFILQKIQNYF
jgi:hypothetical protein